jgi:hypothetical protein
LAKIKRGLILSPRRQKDAERARRENERWMAADKARIERGREYARKKLKEKRGNVQT